MKCIKTVLISSVVCGAMALPLSGVAKGGVADHPIAAFSLVKSIVCAERESRKYEKDPALCTAIGKYMAKNKLQHN